MYSLNKMNINYRTFLMKKLFVNKHLIIQQLKNYIRAEIMILQPELLIIIIEHLLEEIRRFLLSNIHTISGFVLNHKIK